MKRLAERLGNLPLSLKILVSTGFILTIGIATSDWLLYKKAETMLMQSAWNSMHLSLKQQSERITQYLDEAKHDAFLLSHSPTVHQTLADFKAPLWQKQDNSPDYLRIVRLFSTLIEEKGYLQVRLIDLESGMEVVRVNRSNGESLIPDVTPKKQLQIKAGHQYVTEGKLLKPEEIYISEINLNKENGKIAVPHTPTQRFVVGIFNEELTRDIYSKASIIEYIRRLDEELTTAAIRSVQTGNLVWQEHYNYVAPKLDYALSKAKAHLGKDSAQVIDAIANENNSLIEIESKIFTLVSHGNTQLAEKMISGEAYLQHKEKYKTLLNTLMESLSASENTPIKPNKPIAIIVINTNFQDVLSALRSIKTHEILLVNEKGQFLFHPDPSKAFSFEFDDSAQTLEDEEINVWKHLSMGINEKMEFDQHDELHTAQRIFFNGINDNRYLGLVLSKEKNDVLAPAISLGKNAALIAVFSISLSLLITLLAIRRQTRPISDLTNHAVRISAGDLNETIPPSHKKDEVGKLTTAFSNLILKLQAQKNAYKNQAHQIKELNNNLENKIIERTKSLKEATIKAEAASTAKSEFLATMSHEIRTPLNGMLGMAQILNRTMLTIDQKNYVQTINRSGDALLSIINDILDFSKIEAGKLQLEPTIFNLQKVAQEAIELFQEKAKDKNITIILHYNPDTPVYFYGDLGRIRQIILNLLGNAIKFTVKGGVTIQVSSERKDNEKNWLRVSIQDTGIGIAKKDQDKLFSAFQQADASTTRKFGGTGLGLAICKKLIEIMNGTIGFNSTENEGSEFWFEVYLPVAEKPQENNSMLGYEKNDTTICLHGHILLVEDNPINQLVAQEMIECTGVTVDIAENGFKAVDAWKNNQYDLILMDCLMPEMDGYEATKKIRSLENKSRIPIIALTANAMESDRQACHAAGMDDFVSKPIQMDILHATLAQWLSK